MKDGENLYAIGLSKDWVEFRISRDPPKKVRSRAKIPAKGLKQGMMIEMITYKNGSILGCLKRQRVWGVLRKDTPLKGICKMVPLELTALIFKRLNL